MAIKKIDFALRGVFADLNQRTLDAAFVRDFPPAGSFHEKRINDKTYWYYHGYDRVRGKRYTKYAGPDSDEVRARIDAFNEIKADHQSRSELVNAMVAAGFPKVDYLTGRIVDELGKAGLFRLRGVLIGTVAFNAYPGLVGALATRSFQTGDFAQDHGISISIGESIDPVIDVLQGIDPSFRPVPSISSPHLASSFVNARNFKVEFLVPNRGSDDHSGQLTRMPALGGVAAQPLRFMDFLIQETVRSTLMHEAGVGVSLPDPARYAVHKLIVGVSRKDLEKRSKDIAQASFLIEALADSGPDQLSKAWFNAWERGPAWRSHLATGLSRLEQSVQVLLKDAVTRHAPLSGVRPEAVAFNPFAGKARTRT